ncbi:MAG: GGDEF domain-containing protein [Pseudomonadota bacterium]
MTPSVRDQPTLALEFAARVLFAIATFVYFVDMPVDLWRVNLSLTVAGLVAYLMAQSALFGRALFGRPAAWVPVLAAAIDGLAVFGALVSDPFDMPASLLLVLIATLNIGLRHGWLGFAGAALAAGGIVTGALLLRDAAGNDTTAHGLDFLLVFLLACLLYFALQAFRRNTLAEQAARFADQDQETQLLNRRGFDNAASYLLPLHLRTQLPLVIMLASLDTRSGQLLEARPRAAAVRQIGHVVRQRARRSDVVARLSDDEFVFMLFDTPLAGSEKLARALLERFDSWAQTQKIDVRLTFGMIITPEDPVAVDQLIARARNSVQRAQKHPSSPPVVTAPSL